MAAKKISPAKKKATSAKKKTSTKRSSTAKLRAMGSSIMSEAKRIRKASPTKKWTTCVSEAGKKFKRSK